eukprot:gene14611-17265_t
MPLIKIFTKSATNLPLSEIHAELIKIWNVPADVLKLLVVPVLDWAPDAKNETMYVDIRAKQKPERTDEYVKNAMHMVTILLEKHGHRPTVRVELYDQNLQHLTRSKL